MSNENMTTLAAAQAWKEQERIAALEATLASQRESMECALKSRAMIEQERDRLRAERDKFRRDAELLAGGHKEKDEQQQADFEETQRLRSEMERLTKERDGLRLCFAEASHSAGPTTVHVERLEAERDELRDLVGLAYYALAGIRDHDLLGKRWTRDHTRLLNELKSAALAKGQGGETPPPQA